MYLISLSDVQQFIVISNMDFATFIFKYLKIANKNLFKNNTYLMTVKNYKIVYVSIIYKRKY
jgi:hypothetical protein